MHEAKSLHVPGQNTLLAGLPMTEYERLRTQMQAVTLGSGQILNGARKHSRFAYFPLSGLICISVPAGAGEMVNVGLVGNEGMTGLTISLGDGRTPLRERVQVPGMALRLRAAELNAESGNTPLASVLRRYTQAFMAMLAQGVACSHTHRIEQRCARWLLMLDDRLGPGDFPVTHQALAQMLSVRRASVSEVAEKCQDRGLIRYSRGLMAVTDRTGLEKLCCECYRTVRREYDRLLLVRSHHA